MTEMARDNPRALAELAAQAVFTGSFPSTKAASDGSVPVHVTVDGDDWEITLADCTVHGRLAISGHGGRVFLDGGSVFVDPVNAS